MSQTGVDRGKFYDDMASRADWDDWTNRYETQRRLEVIFDRIFAGVRLRDKELLDAGCGGGHFSAAACARGANVTSLDVGESLLAQVAKRCDSRRITGSVLDLPFDDESFDIVLSTEVIEHTTEPERGLRELARVLRPGGVLVVTSPGRLWQPVVRAASLLHLRPYQGYENFLWPNRARDIVSQSGIQVDLFFGFNVLPLFHRSFAAFHVVADRLGTTLPWLCVNWAIRGTKV